MTEDESIIVSRETFIAHCSKPFNYRNVTCSICVSKKFHYLRKKDRDNLISWFIDTLCLHRRREDSASDESGTFSPIHRILSEHLLKFPDKGFETRELAEELGLTPAQSNHFARLVSAGIISTTSGKDENILPCGGSITNAIENMKSRSTIIHKQRIKILDDLWNRGKKTTMKIELPPDGKPSASSE